MRLETRGDGGFTLVELMVVVSIIGMLSSIAITNYGVMMGKARQSEAKILLAAMYTAEQSFYGEQGSYTFCLEQAGYEPVANTRYYETGFDEANATSGINGLCGPSGASTCNIYNYVSGTTCNTSANITLNWNGTNPRSDGHFPRSASIVNAATTGSCTKSNAENTLRPFCEPAQNTLLAFAAGCVDSYGLSDFWTIDQNKVFTHVYSGI